MESSDYTAPVQPVYSSMTRQSLQKAAAQKLMQYAIAQESASEEFQEWGDLNAWNPLALAKTSSSLEKRAREKAKSESSKSSKNDDEKEHKMVARLKAISEHYERKNPELKARTLLSLHQLISEKDSPEEILKKLKHVYTDVALVDEALDFLIETSIFPFKDQLIEAKKLLNEEFSRDIKAGKNISAQARDYAAKGLGSSTALRDLYRQITHNPFSCISLFQELSSKFSLDKMQVIIHFILHSLGADIKSKGPSIAPGELHNMMTETRNMQAVLGIYHYFARRTPSIIKQLKSLKEKREQRAKQ